MRGKLGLVSRFVPFSPSAYAGLTGWWDASDSTALFDATSGGSAVAADGTVARFEDKSGNGRHFTQSVSGSRPIRKTSVQNGLDVLRFDGAGQHMSSSSLFSDLFGFNSTASTCFVVANADSSSADSESYLNPVVLAETEAVAGFFAVRSINSVESFGYDSTFRTCSVAYTFGTWIVLATWHTGSSLNVSVNGGSEQTDTLNARSFTYGSLNLGANSDQTVTFDGDVGEIITYNQTLSSADRGAVVSALLSKWAIS